MKVGVFDSGAGGLTVLKPLAESHFFSEMIYYGDTARVPYGSKDKHTITKYALDAVEFFGNFSLDLLVVACNTVSVTCLDEIRKRVNYPVVGMIEPGVESLLQSGINTDSLIFVLGTRATVHSKSYERALSGKGYVNVEAIATGLLVSLVEEDVRQWQVVHSVMDHYFAERPTPKAIILACTHFPHLAAEFSRYFPSVKLVHSGEAVVSWLRRSLKLSPCFNREPLVRVFATDNPQQLKKLACDYLNTSIV